MQYSKYEKYLIEKGYSVDKYGCCFNKKGIILNGCPNKFGYLLICTRVNKKRVLVKIHRMQAYQKFGESIYNDGILVRHLNGIATDNSYDNIEIGTASDNMMDQPEHIRIRKASNANKKYSSDLILEMKNDSLNGFSYTKIMKKYKISNKGTLSYIFNKRINDEIINSYGTPK